MTDRELMQQALEALEDFFKAYPHMAKGYTEDAIAALRERLEQQEQEPVFHLRSYGDVTAQQLETRQEQDVPETTCWNMEPVAWCVYLPSQQCAEYFDDPDDLWMADMVTNNEDAEVTALYATPQLQQVPGDWSVFNTGAEVASGLSFSEAWEYLTPERLARGWSAVCVVNKDNLPTTSPSAPHSADSADTFCNEPVAYINVETRHLEWAKPVRWETPTVVQMGRVPLYTTPQREWVGLTKDETEDLEYQSVNHKYGHLDVSALSRAIEAALKERNA